MQPNKSEQAVIQSVSIYGTINLEDGTEITCYEIMLQPSVRIEHSKVAIQRYVRKLLTAGQIALVNFIAPQNKKVWRLTLVAKDSELTEQGIKEKTTHAKRYTYLLGPSETCKTAAERFESLSTEKQITFQALVNAFSVEKLSKAFFDEYTLHYQKFCDYLQESNFRKSVFKITIPPNATKEEKDKACKPIRDFVKKLLGRIVFLYFVQKKGWLGASDTQYKDGLTDFIKKLFKESGGDETFYPNWLTKLFFDTLNTDETKRPNEDFEMPDGKKVKVPFLNGGLFDKEDYDEALLTLPAKLFHNPDFEDTLLTEKNKDNARGFLDFLDAFNFTVHEDSPDDHTVAVDPEMLGHIFENLLEDNKDKGAFYTPKEIVHYMCQESLTEYLTTHCLKQDFQDFAIDKKEEILKSTIRSLVKRKEAIAESWPSVQSFQSCLRHIDALLDTVKICDPAIGSGAFPMGLLQEIVAIKEVIQFELSQNPAHPNNPSNPVLTTAAIKENIIQNSIYGVDIEKGAVDIARLRFWLSLVVDEEKPRALPNLDYKIVVGNSLVSKFEDEIIEIDWEIKEGTQANIFGNQNVLRREDLLKKITAKQLEYFHATDKKQLAAEIRNLKIDILINQLELMINTKGLEKKPTEGGKKASAQMELWLQTQSWKNAITKLQKLKQNNEEPFEHFDWKLDFPEVLNPYLVNGNGGFDIVIGNPPYIQLQKDGGRLAKEYENQHFQTFERTGDIYSLFYEIGIKMLKPYGHLCYITSNKWMRAGYGNSTRAFFLQYNPVKLIDLGSGIFESATVDTNILLIQKAPNQKQLQAADLSKSKNLADLEKALYVTLQHLTADSWTISSDIEQGIKAKIEAKGKPLKEWDIQIYRGILTGYNEAFIIDSKKREEILAHCSTPEERRRTEAIIKPILRGRDIKRYHADWAGLWLIATFPALKLNIDDYPAVRDYLKSFGKKLHQTGEEYIDENGQKQKTRKKTGNKWFETQDQIGYYQEFEKEKIIYPNMTLFLPFIYDAKQFYTNQKCFIVTSKSVNLKYLVAYFNSKVSHRWIRENCPELQGGTRELSKIFFENIPTPPLSESEQAPFVALVEQILSQKERGEDTTALEQQIDNLVYKLYDLTYEEVKVIDPVFPLSKEEYESIALA